MATPLDAGTVQTLTTGSQRVAAFVVFGTFLVIMADFPSTAPLSVAFAYLFLIATFFLVGPVAFERIQRQFGVLPPSATGVTTVPGAHGGPNH